MRCVRGRVEQLGPGHAGVSRSLYDSLGRDLLRQLVLEGEVDAARLSIIEPDGTFIEIDDDNASRPGE